MSCDISIYNFGLHRSAKTKTTTKKTNKTNKQKLLHNEFWLKVTISAMSIIRQLISFRSPLFHFTGLANIRLRAQALRKQRLKMREEHGGPLRQEEEELTEHIEGFLSSDEVR